MRKKSSQKSEASSEKKPPARPWPGIILRRLAPPDAFPVATLHVRLDPEGRVVDFRWTSVNEQVSAQAAMVAFNAAIESYLDGEPGATATVPPRTS